MPPTHLCTPPSLNTHCFDLSATNRPSIENATYHSVTPNIRIAVFASSSAFNRNMRPALLAFVSGERRLYFPTETGHWFSTDLGQNSLRFVVWGTPIPVMDNDPLAALLVFRSISASRPSAVNSHLNSDYLTQHLQLGSNFNTAAISPPITLIPLRQPPPDQPPPPGSPGGVWGIKSEAPDIRANPSACRVLAETILTSHIHFALCSRWGEVRYQDNLSNLSDLYHNTPESYFDPEELPGIPPTLDDALDSLERLATSISEWCLPVRSDYVFDIPPTKLSVDLPPGLQPYDLTNLQFTVSSRGDAVFQFVHARVPQATTPILKSAHPHASEGGYFCHGNANPGPATIALFEGHIAPYLYWCLSRLAVYTSPGCYFLLPGLYTAQRSPANPHWGPPLPWLNNLRIPNRDTNPAIPAGPPRRDLVAVPECDAILNIPNLNRLWGAHDLLQVRTPLGLRTISLVHNTPGSIFVAVPPEHVIYGWPSSVRNPIHETGHPDFPLPRERYGHLSDYITACIAAGQPLRPHILDWPTTTHQSNPPATSTSSQAPTASDWVIPTSGVSYGRSFPQIIRDRFEPWDPNGEHFMRRNHWITRAEYEIGIRTPFSRPDLDALASRLQREHTARTSPPAPVEGSVREDWVSPSLGLDFDGVVLTSPDIMRRNGWILRSEFRARRGDPLPAATSNVISMAPVPITPNPAGDPHDTITSPSTGRRSRRPHLVVPPIPDDE